MKRLIFSALIIILSVIRLFCQLPESPLALPSPNATDIGRYGEYPVSPYTGNVQVSIPLHTVKCGIHELPITLNYIGGGVKIDSHPGWVGLNWMLSVGGAITRNIKNMPDEFKVSHPFAGSGYRHNLSKAKQLLNLLKSSGYNNSSLSSYDLQIEDYEPDIFTFNFCGYHGQFMLDTNGKWIVNCDKPVKVIFNGEMTDLYNRMNDSFQLSDAMNETKLSSYYRKFSIIGEDGTIYEFGDNENAIEFSVPILNQIHGYLVPVTWNLTKIKYTDGRTITLTYNRGDFIAQMYLSNSRMSINVSDSEGLSNFGGLATSYGYTYPGDLILPSYLSSITAGSSYISFTTTPTDELTYDWEKQINPRISPSDNPTKRQNMMPILSQNGNFSGIRHFPNCLNGLIWRKLDRIMFEEHIDGSYLTRYKVILFNYTDTPASRLMLNSIDIGTRYLAEKETNNSYKFDYYSPEKLPPYLSMKDDHWGYFNNKYTEPNTYETTTETTTREPNKDVLTYGALKTIIYPTGGSTRFVYEPHVYKRQVNKNRNGIIKNSTAKFAGGIRIKEIYNSPTGKESDYKIQKRFCYERDYQPFALRQESSGVLLAPVCYTTDTKIENIYHDETYQIKVSSSSSALPFTPLSENTHIGYSEVEELYPDGAYSIYKFTNFDNGFTDKTADVCFQEQTPFSQYTSLDMSRGKLLSKSDYSSNGKLLEEIRYSYSTEFDMAQSIPYMNIIYNQGLDYVGSWYLDGSITRFPYFKINPDSEVYTKYDKDGTPVRQYTKTLDYTDQGFIRSSTLATDGPTYIDNFAYPNDFKATQQECSGMVQLNNISPVVEHHKYINYGTGAVPVYTTFFKYLPAMGPVNIDYVRHAGSANDTVQSVRYSYDRYGNLTGERYNSGSAKLYVWSGEANDRLMYAMTFGSLTPEKFTSYTNLIYGNGWGGTSMFDTVSSTAGAEIYSFKYNDDGTIKTLTDTRGRVYNYTYDTLQRLLKIVDADGIVIQSFRYNINLP